MKLLFKRNKLLKYEKHSGQKCRGTKNCLYPKSVIKNETNIAFKDEPNRIIICKYCLHKKYYGPTYIDIYKITRAQYEKIERDNTYCWHPDELIKTEGWRCFKCNAPVKSARIKCSCLKKRRNAKSKK